MIHFLGHAMYFWRTIIKYFDRGQRRVTRFLRITNGIFCGDSFSGMWFCFSNNPFNRTLNNTSYGYSIARNEGRYQLMQILHMNDPRLYTISNTKLQGILDITLQFFHDMGMGFGLEKC